MRAAARAVAVALCCIVVSRAAAAATDPAMAAFQRGAFAEALTGWMREAAAGDGQAARRVGVLYDSGEGVRQDGRAAMEWYRRAAALGDRAGMFNLAVCFDAGRGTARDPVQAARWYRQAAALHDGRAEYDLALMTEDGDGTPRNRRAAARLFLAALRDGIDAARSHLPAAPAPGRDRPDASPDASPDRIFAAAQSALLQRSPSSAARAASLFAQAADRDGSAADLARYDLAWCYQNGVGVPADRQRAYALFVEVAARTGDPALGALARSGAEGSDPARVTVSPASRPVAAETPAASPAGQPD